MSFSRVLCRVSKEINAGRCTYFNPLYRKISTTSRMSVGLFEEKDHAQIYAKYRPTYPGEVYESIKEFCNQTDSPSFQTAVDVGCGSGQSTRPLSKLFDHVIGIDVSGEQIKKAKLLEDELQNVSFRSGPAEDFSFFETSSVDLITVAQALHWLNLELFYKEVTRVLKPGGALVVYGYGNNVIDDAEAQELQHQFYAKTLKGFWDDRRHHIDNHYAEFELPFPGWQRCEKHQIRLDMSVEHYIGYITTWSGWRAYHKEYPQTDELETLKQRLQQIYKSPKLVQVYWPVFIMMGRKPR